MEQLIQSNMKISLIIPSYNNLQHLRNVYASIQKHAPQAEVILLDDGSTDGTQDWIQQQDCIKYRSEERVGHTILYDKGIELATNEIVGILHADMIIGPNYIENLIKHLTPGKVVCATRIEPPLHPEGKEKIIKDFGMDFDTLNIDAFEQFVAEAQTEFKDQTTKGMFAPWILYKSDFQAIGGHDPLFAPFPYEDSDIFQRWILAGYELIQSRDAFVYHLTCRGHRWNEQVGKDDDYYKVVSHRAARNYLRKWGSWIKNDDYQYPIVPSKYNIAFVVNNCNGYLLEALEVWCDRIYIENPEMIDIYVDREQPNTDYDLDKRVFVKSNNDPYGENDIIVEFDANSLTANGFTIIQQLASIIADSGEVGVFDLDVFRITINHIEDYKNNLIKI
jgi:glycosyltransferase involved in cell wall biosynthesis